MKKLRCAPSRRASHCPLTPCQCQYCPLPPCGQKIEKAISSDVAASEPVASLTNNKCLVCTEKTPTIALQPCGIQIFFVFFFTKCQHNAGISQSMF